MAKPKNMPPWMKQDMMDEDAPAPKKKPAKGGKHAPKGKPARKGCK